jgi:hypothetical protein
MPTFVIHCEDKPNSLDLRQATRPAHQEYLRGQTAAKILIGGPLLDAEGQMAGTMLVVEAPDLAAAEALSAGDPYRKADLFARVSVKPWTRVGGAWGA